MKILAYPELFFRYHEEIETKRKSADFVTKRMIIKGRRGLTSNASESQNGF